ncbi:MAG: type II secretion system F family protein [Planctomycetes bacterium]|nr:type II secretion system F family protein [Planctomycetota bacterium]
MAEAVADLSAEGLLLADGLRAAAKDAPTRRMGDELDRVAQQLEKGQSLETVLNSPQTDYPRHMQGLVRAALKTNRLAEVLGEMADHQRTVHELWRSVRSALAYPAILLTFAAVLVLWMDIFVVSEFIQMFEEFELDLPPATEAVVEFHHSGIWWLCMPVVGVLVALVLFRLFGGAVRWRRMLATVPLIGPLWHWTGVCELARLLAVLLEQGVPVPEALRLAADGVHDANMRQVGLWLADGTQQGQPLSTLLESTYRLPATLRPIVRWGERTGELGEAFRVAGAMYAKRVQVRADLVRGVIPPTVYVFVAVTIGFVAIALFLPLVPMC